MNGSVALLLFAAVVVLAAGYVRGYGGFGFAMIVVAALSLVFTPGRIVPVVLILDVCASLLLVPGVWRAADWPALVWLVAGVIAGTPLGVWLLAAVPPAPMKLAVAMAIFLLALLMHRGWVHRRRAGVPMTVAAGMASGVFNGAAAIGGPPAIIFFFSSPSGAAISRASLIVFFLATDLIAVLTCAVTGLLTIDHGRQAVLLALPMAAGLFLGKRAFTRTPEDRFRRRVLMYLMLLSLLAVLRAVQEWIV